MKRKYIILIGIVISLALFGLVSIQVYWINNAILVKQASFKRSVSEAMSNVVDKLEKLEIANQIRQKSMFFERSTDIFHDIDSLNLLYYQELESFRNGSSDDRVNELLRKKSSLFNEVLEDMFAFRHFMDIEKRVDINILDSLINSQLLSKGINTEFEFGVFSASKNRIVIEKTGKYNNELIDKSFGFALFPSDMFVHPDYLMIYFPHEKTFLITQMASMLSISIFLILVIIISFFLSLNAVIKQKRLTELKTDFINNMTHEFKTPVSTIGLACEALMDKDIQKIEGVADNYVQIIMDENKRLGTMAERILQTAVMEKGKLKLKKERVDIHELIDEVIKNIGIQIEINDGTITREFQAASPVINADRLHLTNVIFNLLENANKYSPKKPIIAVSTWNVEGGIEISIKDNGIGISKADQKKIFEKLYRVPTGDVHTFKGFGLGLSYVKAIIDKHGGRIDIESEPNKGSTFTLFLPDR
jgi:two-component system phosphate regulon sensor histidine kinase PhoR